MCVLVTVAGHSVGTARRRFGAPIAPPRRCILAIPDER
jgi:hypothetical protein